jgi:quercetin dioxygenase-like cupin family protein
MGTMSTRKLLVKKLDKADETRKFVDKGHIDILDFAGLAVMRGTFEPGWQWSKHVKPIAKTDTCEVDHVGLVVSGRMKIHMDDGTEQEIGPGDAFRIPPGHDAWVLGDEACVLMDFNNNPNYAKPSVPAGSTASNVSRPQATKK